MASVLVLLEPFNRKGLLHLEFFLVQQPLYLDSKLANSLYKLHQQNLPQVLIHMAVHNTAFPYKGKHRNEQAAENRYEP